MNDITERMRLLAERMKEVADAGDIIAQFISDSWTRGDRLFCGDCTEIRGIEESRTVMGEAKCDGCGGKVKWLNEWRREDVTGMASEYVDLEEWRIAKGL